MFALSQVGKAFYPITHHRNRTTRALCLDTMPRKQRRYQPSREKLDQSVSDILDKVKKENPHIFFWTSFVRMTK
jgi:hypothetical protein